MTRHDDNYLNTDSLISIDSLTDYSVYAIVEIGKKDFVYFLPYELLANIWLSSSRANNLVEQFKCENIYDVLPIMSTSDKGRKNAQISASKFSPTPGTSVPGVGENLLAQISASKF